MHFHQYRKKLSLTWVLQNLSVTDRRYGREIVKHLPDGNKIVIIDFTNTEEHLQSPLRYEGPNATFYPLFNVESTLLISNDMAYEVEGHFQITYGTWYLPIMPKEAVYHKLGYVVC